MKKLFVLVFAIALCLGALCVGASAGYDGTPLQPTVGDGTEESPYQIGTAEELYWFAGLVNGGEHGANAVLTADITINENVLNEDGELNSDTFREWTPIGDSSNAYTGTFDGDGHTISGLYYNGSGDYVGLFGYVGSSGRVQNVNVADSYISNNGSSDSAYVGGVCGCNNGGTITDCSFSGSVFSGNNGDPVAGEFAHVGGVCGWNYGGTITNCSNKGSVNSDAYVGGVCGWNYGGTIRNCYNTGNVTGTTAGGLCGVNDGTIRNCYNTGNVTGTTAGGLCGVNYSTIRNCYNAGNVTGTGTDYTTYVGGVCGHNMSSGMITNCYNIGSVTVSGNGNIYAGGVCGNNASFRHQSTITNCYNTGSVTVSVTGSGNGNIYAGGVCGLNSETITNCYNTGDVTGSNDGSGSLCVGGVCGYNDGTITNCYWLTGKASSGIGDDGGTSDKVESKTAEQFASGAVAWLLNSDQDEDGPWRQNLSGVTDAYPTLDQSHHKVTQNDGGYANDDEHYYDNDGFCSCGAYEPATPVDYVYQIGNAGQLYWFAGLVNGDTSIIGSKVQQNKSANAVLTADITINTGVLKTDGSLNSGIFTRWTPIGNSDNRAYTGTFDGGNHIISGLYYYGSGYYVGLFGYVGSGGQVKNVNVADSYISNSYSNGCAGGVCGQNDYGELTNCSFAGSVTGTNDRAYAGGVCGYNSGTIMNCYNTGSVTGTNAGTNYVGGVCGYNYDGTITNCYWLNSELVGIGGSHEGSTANNVESKTNDQFASGEVAWLLNQGQTNGPWRQNLSGDEDDYPVLDITHEEVVKLTVDGTVSYHNEGYAFSGETNKAYFKDGTEIELPYIVNEDTELTSAAIYTVTVVYDNGTAEKTEQVVDGDTFPLPAAPSKSGYTFVHWSDGNKTYDPGDSVPITGNVTFTAVWQAINIPDPNGITVTQPANGTIRVNPSNGSTGTLITVTATPDEGYELAYITVDGEKITGNTFRMPDKAVTVSAVFVPVTFPFTDVKSGDWFYDAVAYVYANGLMDGTSATTFEPNANMTRAMVWAIIARIDGETVTGEAWSTDARAWAMAEGVSDGTDPNGLVTREQLATMLWRYAVAQGYDVSIGESTNILSYADFASISEYAIPAMQWACGSGVITGVTESTLAPQGTATRAQCAAMLMRFVEL